MRIVLVGVLALFPAVAAAQYYNPYGYRPPSPPPAPSYSYDWQSGNAYRTVPQYGGATTVYGNNYQTGSNWQTTVQPNGNMQGTDSRGNMWNYNAQSGAYMNSNGHGCIGQGYARSCW